VVAAFVLSGVRTVGAEPRPSIAASAQRERTLGEANPSTGEPCAPRASLEGDAEAVARVGAELERLGVTVGSASAGCRSVSAAVELDRSGGIAVAVRDSAKRSEGRVVSDPALAAAWIDTWLHDDFEVAAAPAIAPPSATAPLVDAVVAVAPTRDPFDRFAVSSSYELARTDSGASWSGFGVAACARVGELCIGARARYLDGTESTKLTAASRTDTSLLATASWSQQIGTMSIAPELGLGVGRMTTDRVDGCTPPPGCDPNDPTCKLPPPPCTPTSGGTNVYVGDGFHTATITPRAEAALRIAIPLFAHVWLDGTAAVTLAPFGHSDTYTPTMAPPGTTPDDIALPGEPLAAFQLGIGLRVGAR
jgi:hypothetical protein